jgi:hypothetical protein
MANAVAHQMNIEQLRNPKTSTCSFLDPNYSFFPKSLILSRDSVPLKNKIGWPPITNSFVHIHECLSEIQCRPSYAKYMNHSSCDGDKPLPSLCFKFYPFVFALLSIIENVRLRTFFYGCKIRHSV